MRRSVARTFIAGIAAGAALNVMIFATFGLVGMGLTGGGVLLDPGIQSPKLIAVWTELAPLPLVFTSPWRIALGLFFFGFVHAFIYSRFSRDWPNSLGGRALRLGSLVFFMSFLFWEFFTPYNLFGEPVSLIILELFFWAVVAWIEAYTIAVVFERNRET